MLLTDDVDRHSSDSEAGGAPVMWDKASGAWSMDACDHDHGLWGDALVGIDKRMDALLCLTVTRCPACPTLAIFEHIPPISVTLSP